MLKKNIIIIFITIIFIGYFGSLKAIEKISIINNFNSAETLKFDFAQESFDKNEKPTKATLGFAESCGVKIEELKKLEVKYDLLFKELKSRSSLN